MNQNLDKISADLVVYGKIFTSENNQIVEAFAVKDGKYIYVGDKKGAEAFILPGKTEVVDYTPLNLDELFADVPSKELSEEEQQKEKKRFTQVLSFDWSEPDFTEVKL